MGFRARTFFSAGYLAWQAAFLFGIQPLFRAAARNPTAKLPNTMHALGIDLYGFAVRNTGRLGEWVPQLLFMALSAALIHAALGRSTGGRPALGVVARLAAALGFTAGVTELARAALDELDDPSGSSVRGWLARTALGTPEASGHAVLSLAIATCGWAALKLAGRWWANGSDRSPARPERSAPVRTRGADAVAAALIPTVLLALAGGPLLRHSNVRPTASGTVVFDPDTWIPYHAPEFVETWRGILYPALRMRPVRTEHLAGWLGTTGAFLVLVGVLSAFVLAVHRRAAGKRAAELLLECWGGTVLAAAAAAVAEATLFAGVAPHTGVGVFSPVATALGDALRFGTVWGWTTGAALLGWRALADRQPATTATGTRKGLVDHAR